jgi:ribose transport system permease protein
VTTPTTDPATPEARHGDHHPDVPHHVGMASALQRAVRATNAYVGVGSVLAALVVFLSITQEGFLTWDNFVNILTTNSVLLVVAVGLTFVLLHGGIDLSLGGLMALTGVAMAELMDAGWPTWIAAIAVVAMAGAIGTFVNGVLIGKVGLSFLVVTLGTATILRGVAQVRTEGQSISLFGDEFLSTLGSDDLLGIPLLVWMALAITGAGMVVLRYTGFGRMVYATGGNREAARYAGIHVTNVSVAVFGIAGLLAGLAAVMNSARLANASPTAATNIELTAAAAVLLGGTSFMGGRGSLLGTVLGVMFLGVLSNGITLMGISPFWQGIVSGVVLIAAVLVDRIRNGVTMP